MARVGGGPVRGEGRWPASPAHAAVAAGFEDAAGAGAAGRGRRRVDVGEDAVRHRRHVVAGLLALGLRIEVRVDGVRPPERRAVVVRHDDPAHQPREVRRARVHGAVAAVHRDEQPVGVARVAPEQQLLGQLVVPGGERRPGPGRAAVTRTGDVHVVDVHAAARRIPVAGARVERVPRPERRHRVRAVVVRIAGRRTGIGRALAGHRERHATVVGDRDPAAVERDEHRGAVRADRDLGLARGGDGGDLLLEAGEAIGAGLGGRGRSGQGGRARERGNRGGDRGGSPHRATSFTLRVVK